MDSFYVFMTCDMRTAHPMAETLSSTTVMLQTSETINKVFDGQQLGRMRPGCASPGFQCESYRIHRVFRPTWSYLVRSDELSPPMRCFVASEFETRRLHHQLGYKEKCFAVDVLIR